MDLKALQLCSRFAIQPNSLGYCGLPSAQNNFLECIHNDNCSHVAKEIENFIVLNPYLETISKIVNLNKFSFKVIESYWYGNQLLDSINPNHYQLLIKNLQKQGVPQFLINEISKKIPNKFIPIHLFNILYVGVGKASGSVPFNLKSINNCMIRWGIIENISDQITVNTFNINSKLKQIPYKQKIIKTNSLVSNLKIGDEVSIHWDYVADRPSSAQLKNLKNWTNQLLASL